MIEGAYVFMGDIITMESRAETRWPYSLQSLKVSKMCDGKTGFPYRNAFVGSLYITRVTRIDASRSVKIENDFPNTDLGRAALWGKYK